MKKILVFGGTSFVGKHFEKSFKSEYIVKSYGRSVDVRKKDAVINKVKSFEPDIVINMASVPTIRDSFKSPNLTYSVSFHGTDNILSSLSDVGFNGEFLYISSSEVYGDSCPKEGSISEFIHTSPESPYAVAKLSAESLCKYYANTAPFSVNVARPFNHIGPEQTERFAISNFAKQLVEIYYGMKDPIINIGNLDIYRDFTDVRDVVEAYRLIVESGVNGKIYNICSGRSLTLENVLCLLIKEVGVDPKIEIDNKILRNNEKLYVRGSNKLILNELGWKPKISLDRTVNDIVDSWKSILKK